MSLPPSPRLPHPRRRETPGSPPLSPRGHCPPAPTKPMHPENKLTNHGKTGNGGAQSQHQNVNQGPTCNLGSKGVGAGNHGAKANQISPSNSSLKNTQAGVPPFSSLKGKVKRERSVSVDSGEQREAGTPSLDSEAKGTPFPDPQEPSMFHSPSFKLAGILSLSPLPNPHPQLLSCIDAGPPFFYPYYTHQLGFSQSWDWPRWSFAILRCHPWRGHTL